MRAAYQMVSLVLVIYVILFRQPQIMQLRQDVLHSQVMWFVCLFVCFKICNSIVSM